MSDDPQESIFDAEELARNPGIDHALLEEAERLREFLGTASYALAGPFESPSTLVAPAQGSRAPGTWSGQFLRSTVSSRRSGIGLDLD